MDLLFCIMDLFPTLFTGTSSQAIYCWMGIGNFEPRVSDFGLARIISSCESHVSTILAGTFGYIPPSMTRLWWLQICGGDARAHNKKIPSRRIKCSVFFAIARLCTHDDPWKRPTMFYKTVD